MMSCLTMAVSYLDRQTLAVLAPTITKDLSISDEAYGWLASAFSFAYLFGPPVAGALLDRVGVRKGLPVAVVFWSIVSAMHAFAPGFAALFTLRVLLGLAESPTFPGAAQAVYRALPVNERSRGLGLLYTGSSLGALVAPLLATQVAIRFGWRPAFLVTSAVGLIWVPLWMLATRSRGARTVLARTQTTEGAKSQGLVAGRLELLCNVAVLRAMAVTFACAPVYAFVLLWGAKYLVFQFGLTQKQIGYYLWLPPLFFDVGSVTFGDQASRFLKRRVTGEPPRLILCCAMLLVASTVLLPLASEAWGATIIMGLMSAGVGGLYTLTSGDMLLRMNPTAISSATGMTAATQSLAQIIASPLIGWAVVSYHSYTAALIVLGIWALPGCLFWVWKKPPAAYGLQQAVA